MSEYNEFDRLYLHPELVPLWEKVTDSINKGDFPATAKYYHEFSGKRERIKEDIQSRVFG